jgi:gliding motility-associated-like protein
MAWVTSNPVLTATSPDYTAGNCTDINYTISSSETFNGVNNGFPYDNNCILFPSNIGISPTFVDMSITFNQPINNLRIRFIDLDENVSGFTQPEETITQIVPPPSSVTNLNLSVNPFFLVSGIITPNDNNSGNNNNDASGWVNWTGSLSSVSFRYNRPGSAYALIIDSIYFDCPNSCSVVANAGPDITLCNSNSSIINATNANATSYLWNTGATTSSINVSTTGTYWVDISNGTCTDRDSVVVSSNISPSVSLGNDTSACAIQPLIIESNSSVGVNYLWSDNTTSDTLIANGTGIYWVQVSNVCGIDSDTILITLEIPPTLNIGNDTSICINTQLTLNPSLSNASLIWQDNSSNSTYIATQAGSYWVTATTLNCVVSDTIQIGINTPPSVLLGNDITVCSNINTILTPSITGNYSSLNWDNNSSSLTQTVTTSGIYWIDVTNTCGTDRDSINVIIENAPIVYLGNDSTICTNTTLILNPNISNATYLWQNNSTASSFLASQAGIYWVDVTQGSCIVRDSIEILIQNEPSINLGNDSTLCEEFSTTLNATFPGATYLWQNNSTAPTLTVNQPGVYWVNVSNQCGIDSDTFNLTIQNLPIIDFTNDTIFCLGESIILDATTPNASYLWQDNTTNPTLTVSQNGPYSVMVLIGVCQIQHFFEISTKICNSVIEMPTIFSPNGDGTNEYFTPVAYEKIKSARLIIVNRWGNLIYDETNLLSGWDGTSNGKECTEGVYFWKIDYEDFDSSKFTSQGFLHLIR